MIHAEKVRRLEEATQDNIFKLLGNEALGRSPKFRAVCDQMSEQVSQINIDLLSIFGEAAKRAGAEGGDAYVMMLTLQLSFISALLNKLAIDNNMCDKHADEILEAYLQCIRVYASLSRDEYREGANNE